MPKPVPPSRAETGPLLFLRSVSDACVQLALVVARPTGSTPPAVSCGGGELTSHRIWTAAGMDIYRAELQLPSRPGAFYEVEGQRYELDCDYTGDLRIAFASCNGQEHGDLDRTPEERNVMWQRLLDEHRTQRFQLLINGGDQIYADEVTQAHPLSREWPDSVDARLNEAEREELHQTLADDFALRYLAAYAQPGFATLAATVPMLAIWDDHDICDGWGSLPERVLDSDVGRCLFSAARAAYLVFQQGEAPGAVPSHTIDRSGLSLSWRIELPGTTIFAPDLRSERRPDRIMGEVGWSATEQAFGGSGERLLIVASVPILGPRLSLVERLMVLTPWAEKYEDDLRDQWQSRVHRTEWTRLLRSLVELREGGTAVTVVSGEIHLATRATMGTAAGDIHQLVASGITHPAPPQGYARALGLLARLGESPLPRHPIRIRPLPGYRSIYAAERNFLVLERRSGEWTASWHLEDGGKTPEMTL